MFLKKNNFLSTISAKILIWYSVLFITNAVFLFLLAYFIVSTTLRDKESTALSLEKEKILLLIQKHGPNDLEKFLTHKEKMSFFIKIYDYKNKKTIFLNRGDVYLEPQNITEKNTLKHFLTVNHRENIYKFKSIKNGNYIIAVGKNIDSTEELLENFREIFFGMILFTMLIGIFGGLIALKKILNPIKNITLTAQYIINTGKLNERIKLPNTQDELYKLSVIINKMLDRIDILVNTLKDTINNVAHDLRTPLARIKITSELALNNQANINPKDALLECLEESDKILILLNAIVDISQIESGTLKLNLEKISLKQLIDDVIDLYEYVIEEQRINLKVKCANDIFIYGDFNRLRQSLSNLIDNAIKYNKENGCISIKAIKLTDKALLFIRDSGIGIAQEDLPHIFEKLYRADKSRSKQGLGLGLSIVKAILKAHNASIKVKSNLNCGTIFCMIFPTLK